MSEYEPSDMEREETFFQSFGDDDDEIESELFDDAYDLFEAIEERELQDPEDEDFLDEEFEY